MGDSCCFGRGGELLWGAKPWTHFSIVTVMCMDLERSGYCLEKHGKERVMELIAK